MKKISAGIAVLISASFLFAQGAKPEDFVSAEYLELLKKDGKIELIHEKDDTNLNLVPDCKYGAAVEAEKILMLFSFWQTFMQDGLVTRKSA